ncbi:hypothetical protein A9Q84_20220 [Halobacteriovorax marinus]|uniref:Ankyrin repeat domain-containing protein n=1 Tax=Halobacteriovorax marinus TaxID=97084 RepID=A0A1Y5F505_9BACT|nr:hypothetical protein A9Q84_20220 [Halobacteriovorax marinus]
MKIKTLFLLTILLSFASCDEEVKLQEFNDIYVKTCKESVEVAIENITKDATCNGQPLLLALLQSEERRVIFGLPDIFSYLVKRKGFDANFKVGSNSSFLLEVIKAKRINLARRVLNKAPLYSEDYSYTALHALIENSTLKDSDHSNYFINHYSGDLEKETPWGKSPLALAYENNLPNIVWSLLSRGVDNTFVLKKIINNEISPDFYFHSDIVAAQDLLREATEGLNRRFSYAGKTNYALIHYAAENGNTALMKLLISLGVDTTFESSIGSPLEIAAANGHKEIIHSLLESYSFELNSKAINNALLMGHVDIANLLLNAGINVFDYTNLVSHQGEGSSTNYFSRFLKNGGMLVRYHVRSKMESVYESHSLPRPEYETKNNILHTFLGFDLPKETKVVSSNLKFLKREVRKVWANWRYIAIDDQYNLLGQSPLSYALYSRGNGNYKFLSTSKVTTSKLWKGHWAVRDRLGFVPLHYAFMSKVSIPTVKELKRYVANGADLNFINPLNESVLLMATRFGKYEIAKYLLKKPVFSSRPDFNISELINLKNVHGETVLSLAKKTGNKKLIKLIKNAGGI